MRGNSRLAVLSVVMILLCLPATIAAQELNCRVSINSSQVQGTNTQVFQTLENALMEFINEQEWTTAHYSYAERIACNFSIVVKEYSDDGTFKCELTVQSTRPAFNSNYNSTVWNFKDESFDFNYIEYDPLEFRYDLIDNNLTAVIAYYCYLIIGLDMDTMSPMGGTDVLQKAVDIVNAAQSLAESGWQAFDDSRNRYAVIFDYIDEGMKPLRQFMYDYHRLGLDEMAQNADRGRATIASSIKLLQQAKSNRPMSSIPDIIVETKKNELLNVFSRGPQKERDEVYECLMQLSPANVNDWDKIRQATNN